MIEAAVVDASVALKWVIGEPGEDAAPRLDPRMRTPLVTADRRFAAAVGRHAGLATSVLLLEDAV